MSDSNTKQVTIRHKAFSYRVLSDHPVEPGKQIYVEHLARRGDTIDVLPEDYVRGERFGAFEGVGPEPEPEPSGVPDLATATDTDLINWIKDGSPTVQDVVDASQGNPEYADRLLTAEAAATGNDSRKGVVEGLQAVVRRAEEE